VARTWSNLSCIALVAPTGAAGAIVAAHVYLGWLHHAGVNHVSGTWMALAADFRDGLYYRPLLDSTEYGGTRYFPLHFVLHGGLMKLGAPPEAAGYALAVLCTGALLLGGLRSSSRSGRSTSDRGWCFHTDSRGGFDSARAGLPRGDVLPAALGVWGLAVGHNLPYAQLRASHR
jgi:hypothetical protein